MKRNTLYALALCAAIAAPFVARAAWDSKFFYVGRVGTLANTNTSFTLPQSLKGQYVKANCHDDGGSPIPLDTWLGVGRLDAGTGTTLGNGSAKCLLADGGYNCDLVRFSLGEKFYQQMLPGDDTVWAAGTDAGWCDLYVAGN